MARSALARIFATAAAVCAVLGPMAVMAEEAMPPTRVEVTLFGGYRFGGSGAFEESISVSTFDVDLAKGSSYGLALNWEAEEDSFFEFAYSQQSTTVDASTPFDVSVEYLQIGGYTITAKNTARVVPYFLLTIGAGRLVPDDPELRELTKFAAAIGGGAKVNFTPHIGMRIDARLYATFLGSDENIFCASADGVGCSVHLQGDTLVQPEISLGFTYGF